MECQKEAINEFMLNRRLTFFKLYSIFMRCHKTGLKRECEKFTTGDTFKKSQSYADFAFNKRIEP